MIENFEGKVAVLTGAASGFGLECARLGARLGMKLVLVDVQAPALEKVQKELQAQGAQVWSRVTNVSDERDMQALADHVAQHVGVPHLIFNNAGVAAGGLLWENTVADWEWVLGVNLWGVVHGVRLFTPMMLQAQRRILEPLSAEQRQQFMTLLDLLVNSNNEHSRVPSESRPTNPTANGSA